MTPQVLRYPVDPTGKNPNNRVQGEVRTLLDRPRRVIVPTYGAFFADSLVIRDAQRMIKLERNVHYVVMGLYAEATAQFGQEVAAIIVITSPAISSEITFNYQVVGGHYQSVLHMVAEVIKNLSQDDREIVWEAIANRPSSFYPAHHFHDVGDIYGFDPVVNSVETLRSLAMAGDRVAQDDLYLNVDRRISQLSRNEENNGKAKIVDHTAVLDPHSQYGMASDVKGQRPNIRKPVNLSPVAGATLVPVFPTLVAGPYYSAYRIPLRLVQFQISRSADFATIIDDSGPITPVPSYTSKTKLLYNTDYYWRVRFNDEDNNDSEWSVPTKFRTVGN